MAETLRLAIEKGGRAAERRLWRSMSHAVRPHRTTIALSMVLCWAAASPAAAAEYAAQRNGDTVRLEDHATQTVVSIVPSVGNIAFELGVKGQNVLHWPYASLDDFKAKPGMSGIPFLGPWANRLDEPAFYANGRRYAFDMELGNVRGPIPIHGFLTTNDQWQVIEVNADADVRVGDEPAGRSSASRRGSSNGRSPTRSRSPIVCTTASSRFERRSPT